MTHDQAIIEAAARAMMSAEEWSSFWDENDAKRLVVAAAPLIEAAALERAAKVAEEWLSHGTMQLRAGEMTAQELRTAKAVVSAICATIRALKEQP